MSISLQTMFEKDTAMQVKARELLEQTHRDFHFLCADINKVLAQNKSSFNFYVHDPEFEHGEIHLAIRNYTFSTVPMIDVCCTVSLSNDDTSTYEIEIDYAPEEGMSDQPEVEVRRFPATERGVQELSVKLLGLISPYLTYRDRMAYFKLISERQNQSMLNLDHG